MKSINRDGIKIPSFFYGTAWKEEKTESYVLEALKAGFKAIDTANQRKHYFEEGVGTAFNRYLKESNLERNVFFLQSKFTYERGQDHRLPFDKNASLTTQVQQSFQSSLDHFKTDYLDSLVLHGPYSHGTEDITEEDLEVWQSMENLYHQKKIRFLGVSNIIPEQLAKLYNQANVKPTFVQNRCYAQLGWDKWIREICNEANMLYQGFSLLTANRRELGNDKIIEISKNHGKTIPQIIFRFSIQVGMIPLTGTTKTEHMSQDLNIFDFELTPEEIKIIENIG